MEQGLLPLETLQEHRMEDVPLYLLLHAVELFLGQGIYTSVGRSWEFYL